MQDEAQKRDHGGSAYPILPLVPVDGVFGMDNNLAQMDYSVTTGTMMISSTDYPGVSSMKVDRLIKVTAVLTGLSGAVVSPAAAPMAQENCTELQFARGQSSATVHGVAPPEKPVCYTFPAGAGQEAHIEVVGNNMIISIIGVGDARTSWNFVTKAQTYKFIVGQLMRSVQPERYTVTLSIR
jgi:hypothetical protein